MIIELNYTQGTESIELTADTDSYPITLTVKCFKTQPPPPTLEPCYQFNNAIVTPILAGFPTQGGYKMFSLGELILIDSYSSVIIQTRANPDDLSTPRDMEINLSDAEGYQVKLTLPIVK